MGVNLHKSVQMIKDDDLKKWHEILKDEQERLEPHLTLERMGELLGRNKQSVRHVLYLMEQRGMVEPVKFGLRKRYRIV